MARFKAPKITQAQRINTVLELAELVFDVDEGRFYSGNNVDFGGIAIGSGLTKSVFEVTINSTIFNSKFLTLPQVPVLPNNVTLEFFQGTKQRNGIDFEVQTGTNIVSWDGLGLDGFIEVGDILIIEY